MTFASKGWRGNLKVLYEGTPTCSAADKAALDAAAVEEYIQDVSVNVEGGLEELYHLSARLAKEIKEGNISIRFSITRDFVDLKFAHFAGIDSSFMLPGTACIAIYPLMYVTGRPAIYVCGKFANWRLTEPQADNVRETFDFIGTCIATGLVP